MARYTVLTSVNDLRKRLSCCTKQERIAFVPTMGALHHGHIALVREAKRYGEVVVVSIFVNPNQFNNEEDLRNYPRTLERDLQLLSEVGEVIVFAPNTEEVYPKGYSQKEVDLGRLESVMEGAFRPGHFKGVVNVVSRLFEVIKPHVALFGIKDFQQVAVIRRMVELLNYPVEIIAVETVREPSGLASSSRNERLSDLERQEAEIIYKTMLFAKEHVKMYSPCELQQKAVDFFGSGSLRLEYLSIVDPETLENLENWTPGARICIAAYCGEVRLIDNLELLPK